MVSSKFCKWWKSTAQPRGLGRSSSGSRPLALIRARPRSGKECLPTAGLQHFLQGSDLAGMLAEVGPGVANVAVGDEVIGFTNDRSSQAEFVLVESGNLVPRPRNVSWEQAGALFRSEE